jgi:hypothetical protein
MQRVILEISAPRISWSDDICGSQEAPGAYKDVDAAVDSAECAGLARKVDRLVAFICVQGLTPCRYTTKTSP